MPERVQGKTTLQPKSHMGEVSHGLTQLDPLKIPCIPDSRQAHDVWSKIKPEYYGILSIFTYNVVKRACSARSKREPFGLIQADVDEDNHTYKPSSVKSKIDFKGYNPFGDLQDILCDKHYMLLL